MSAVPSNSPPVAAGRNPTWLVAKYFPQQGEWTEGSYIDFTNDKRGLELVDGRLEELPVPTEKHQEIVLFLVNLLRAFVKPQRLGRALYAGLRVRLKANEMREPDVVFIRRENDGQRGNDYWRGADLVMEVVSPDDPKRDYQDKRRSYAQAGIGEYWIVDPMKRTILVLVLKDGKYVESGAYVDGAAAMSVSLDGFRVDVSECFAAGDE